MNDNERVEAVAKAIYAISPLFEWAGSGMTMYSPVAWERLDSIDSDEFLDFARAAIAALDIPAIERAAYERGRAQGRRDCGVMPKDDDVWTFKFSIPLTGRSQPGDGDE